MGDTPKPPRPAVLVTDFDGTVTRNDFYRLALARLIPPGVPHYWADYLAGRMSHFEVLQAYFAAIRSTEAEALEVVEEMRPDPNLAAAVAGLHAAGWDVVVASAGCDWYIRPLLAASRVDVEVHANPGRFVPGRGLLMDLPAGSPYFSPTHGIDKAAVVRGALQSGRRVAFAGDGFPDEEAARLVPPGLRFAKADLAAALRRAGQPFRPFERWSEVARGLLESDGSCSRTL